MVALAVLAGLVQLVGLAGWGWLHQLQAEYHFACDCEFISSEDNAVSDLLSRFRFPEFRRHVANLGFPSHPSLI